MKFYNSSHIDDNDVYYSNAIFDPYSIRGAETCCAECGRLIAYQNHYDSLTKYVYAPYAIHEGDVHITGLCLDCYAKLAKEHNVQLGDAETAALGWHTAYMSADMRMALRHERTLSFNNWTNKWIDLPKFKHVIPGRTGECVVSDLLLFYVEDDTSRYEDLSTRFFTTGRFMELSNGEVTTCSHGLNNKWYTGAAVLMWKDLHLGMFAGHVQLGTKNINTHSSWSHADNHSPNFKDETVSIYGLIDNATEVQPEDIDITDIEKVPNFKGGILDENADRMLAKVVKQ